MTLLNNLYSRFEFNALVSGKHKRAVSWFEKSLARTGETMGANHNLGMAYLAWENFALRPGTLNRPMAFQD